MDWYWWVLIVWVVSGLAALGLEFRSNPAFQGTVGMAELWPVVLGPLWLVYKFWQLVTGTKSY